MQWALMSWEDLLAVQWASMMALLSWVTGGRVDVVRGLVGCVVGFDVVGGLVGCVVGLDVVGGFVGCAVGFDVVGGFVGCAVGFNDGFVVVGDWRSR